MRVLIVEDDAKISTYIAKGLKEAGHSVDCADNGEDGLHLISSETYDCLVIDRLLPKLDGLSLIQELRGQGNQVGVLILSALGDLDSRVQGLRAGGDDYLVKPFAFIELLARLEALAKRRYNHSPKDTAYKIGAYEMDLLSRKVKKNGISIELQAREFQLLEYLMRFRGQLVTRTMLLEGVWDYHFDPQTSVIDVHMSRLRKKLEDNNGTFKKRCAVRDISSKSAIRAYWRSSSFSMALLFAGLLGLSAFFLAFTLYDHGRQDFLRDSEAILNGEIKIVQLQSNAQEIKAYIEHRLSQDTSVHFRLENLEGQFLGGDLHVLPSKLSVLTEGLLNFENEKGQQLAAKIYTLQEGTRLIIARDISDRLASLARFKILSGFIFVFISLVVLVSFVISYFVVSRINRIAETAQSIINSGDYSKRISVETRWDDLSNLSLVLNSFLERNETLMESLRQIGQNIAHDLRTPLTALKHDIEALKSKPYSEIDIEQILHETDRVLNLFNAILRISALENQSIVFKEIDLSHILTDVIELYEPLAEEKNIQLITHFENGKTTGDKDLLFQLFTNLLDNALKFSPPHSKIQICLKNEIITFEDEGIGLDVKDYENVFKQFYRVESSRNTAGNGLGLSLAQVIVQAHKGIIYFEPATPGLRVIINLTKM